MKLLISCPAGVGSLLASELKRLQFRPFGTFSKGTWVETDLRGLYMINLRSRIANKVYVQIASGGAKTFDQLFESIKKSEYGYRTANSKISLKVSTYNSQLSALRSIQSVAHKALLDSIAHFAKQQVDVDELLLLLDNDNATLLLNTSGASLHNRGYRTNQSLAPIKENLAVALLLLASWKFKAPLIDPFCGAGTIPIEALLLAKNIAPGKHRNFAFEKFSRYDEQLRTQVKEEADSKIFHGKYQIVGYDQDPKMIAFAKSNAKNRGLDRDIFFEERKFSKSDFLVHSGDPKWIITNPPYGKRLQPSELTSLYKELYDSFGEQSFGGVITSFEQIKPNPEQWRAKLIFNGEEKCTFWHKNLN